MVNKLKIIGLDPGSQFYGIAHLEATSLQNVHLVDHYLIRITKSWVWPKKLVFIQDSLREIIENIKPDLIYMESAFVGKNNKTAIALGRVQGVTMSVAGTFPRVVFKELSPSSVKSTITGKGNADKTIVQDYIFRLLGVSPQTEMTDHESDAMAIAYAGVTEYIWNNPNIFS